MKNQHDVMTVTEFCNKYRINKSTYYRNSKLGRMPATIQVGGSKRILAIHEEKWLTDNIESAATQESPQQTKPP